MHIGQYLSASNIQVNMVWVQGWLQDTPEHCHLTSGSEGIWLGLNTYIQTHIQ